MGTNVNWLIGHILVSRYFHAILCVEKGAPKLYELLPDYRYGKLYRMKSEPGGYWEIKPDRKALQKDMQVINEYLEKVLSGMDENDLGPGCGNRQSCGLHQIRCADVGC